MSTYVHRYAPSKAKWFINEALRMNYLTKFASILDTDDLEEDEVDDAKFQQTSYGLGIRAILEYPPHILAKFVI